MHTKEDGALFQTTNKKKKQKKTVQDGPAEGNKVDIGIIKKFTDLKTTVPMKDEDFKLTIDSLGELKDALLYWGKIIQRQSKIKHIRTSRKLQNDPDYKVEAEKEEAYIEKEKAKYLSSDTSKHELNLDKLKIAQVIDREARMDKSWNDAEDDEEFSDEEKPK